MTHFRDHLDSHKNLRLASLAVGLVVASFSLYVGTAMRFFVPNAGSLMITVFVLVALILDFGVAWTFHRHTSQNFGMSILLSSIAILVGTVVVSVLIWRQHWLELVKELFRVR
jgi:hypothetical protein